MKENKELSLGAQVDGIMDMLDRYYSAEHYSKDDVAFTIGNNINFPRVKLLLETLLLSGIDAIPASDYHVLLGAFDDSCFKYMQDYIELNSISGGSRILGYYIITLYNRIKDIRTLYYRNRIVEGMRKAIGNNLQTLDTVKNNIKHKTFSKNVGFISHYYPLDVLIESNDGAQFIAQVQKNGKISILYDFGKATIDKYTFGDKNRVFVVKQKDVLTLHDLRKIMHDFCQINPIGTLKDFLFFIKEEYQVDLISYSSLEDLLDLQFGDIRQNIVEDVFLLVAKNIQTTLSKQRLLLYTNQNRFIDFGTFKDVSKPVSIKENGYKGLPGLSMNVTGFGNQKSIIVTNGFDIDAFPYEE